MFIWERDHGGAVAFVCICIWFPPSERIFEFFLLGSFSSMGVIIKPLRMWSEAHFQPEDRPLFGLTNWGFLFLWDILAGLQNFGHDFKYFDLPP